MTFSCHCCHVSDCHVDNHFYAGRFLNLVFVIVIILVGTGVWGSEYAPFLGTFILSTSVRVVTIMGLVLQFLLNSLCQSWVTFYIFMGT